MLKMSLEMHKSSKVDTLVQFTLPETEITAGVNS